MILIQYNEGETKVMTSQTVISRNAYIQDLNTKVLNLCFFNHLFFYYEYRTLVSSFVFVRI